uniref:Uncharacterized protein n=1 Tax=Brassica oleracea TaxID=3712 RepID=A0A3P6FWP0_BRAOL|nr:unnamed protein product [Brassica oleracea]
MVVESLPSFQGRLMPHGIEKRETRKMKTEVYRESGRCFWSIFDSSIM